MLSELGLTWLLACMVILSSIIYVYNRFFSLHGLPSNLPWAGCNSSALSRAKSVQRSLFGLHDLIQDGYYKYSKNDEVFVLPNLVTGPEVILPMSQIKWLLEQPDSVLNQNEVNREFLHADRTMLHRNIIRDRVHDRVIKREMTKKLDTYANEIVDEIDHALSLNWGTDTTHFKEVALYDTMLDVISRISNRVLVGKQLCRNKDYLHSSSTYARNVVITAGLINLLPAVLRPLLSPIITAYDMFHYRKIAGYIFPLVKERIHDFKPGMDYHKPDYSKHNDYVQWALHDAFSHDDPLERTPEMITKRLTVLSFAAIQSSVITITNTLFDIASCKNPAEVQKKLRDEIHEITSERQEDSRWTRTSLSRMIRLDSALRESMRLWGFVSRGVMKMVVAPEGVTLPCGEHLPHGSKVGVTAFAVHHDESIYPNVYQYDAFRFSKAVENPKLYGKAAGCTEHQRAVSLVNSSDHFMGFSHGQHACPGRFFAANQLKLLLAQIALKYELEPIEKRPENPWLNNTIGPPIFSTMRIRRRPDTVPPLESPVAPVVGVRDVRRRHADSVSIAREMLFPGQLALLDNRYLQALATHELGTSAIKVAS